MIEQKPAIANEDTSYRLLVESITDYSIYMLDTSGVVSTWNSGAKRSKGYHSSEIIGKHFSCFFTEQDRRAGLPEQALATAAAQGRFEHEGWKVRNDGSRFWAHVVIDPITEMSGKLVGFAAITRDRTEHRMAEETQRQSEQQFKLLVQGVTDYAIYMLSPEGQVSSWNPGAQRIKGYTPAEIIGQHFSRFYTDEDRNAGAPQHSLDEAIREGRFEKEGWRVRKDGSRFMAHVVIDAIRGDDGNLVGFAKITRDITERKLAQQSLEQAQQTLFQTQKLETLGQLTGGIAHDFNNLLTVIIGSLELLRKPLAHDVKSAALLDNAIQAAERGATMTQRMLAFARRQDLKPESVDLCVLVTGMIGLLQRSLGSNISIRNEIPKTLFPVRCDANHLETALLNLALNARDAMPEGGEIRISGKEMQTVESNDLGLQPGHYVCLSVSDSGHGMNKETLSRATEPFFTTKGVGKGTGLGLSMVQGLTEQSGGKLAISSGIDKGTSVDLWLPASVSNDVAERQPQDNSDEVSAATSERSPCSILVVDDDGLVLTSTSAILEMLGYRVLQANSGSQALEMVLQNANIDIVLTDQTMPGMTGLQLIAAIREHRSELPIILATGYAEIKEQIPSNLYRLAKPFRVPELAQIIASVRVAEKI